MVQAEGALEVAQAHAGDGAKAAAQVALRYPQLCCEAMHVKRCGQVLNDDPVDSEQEVFIRLGSVVAAGNGGVEYLGNQQHEATGQLQGAFCAGLSAVKVDQLAKVSPEEWRAAADRWPEVIE